MDIPLERTIKARIGIVHMHSMAFRILQSRVKLLPIIKTKKRIKKGEFKMKTSKVLTIALALIAFVAHKVTAGPTTPSVSYWSLLTGSDHIKNTNIGNVGIGDGLTYWNKFVIDPSRKGLWLDGRYNEIQWLSADSDSGFGHRLYTHDLGWGLTQLRIDGRSNTKTWTTLGVINNTGTFGINNINPSQQLKLDVNGYIGYSNNDVENYSHFLVSSAQPRGLWLTNNNELQWLTSYDGGGYGWRVYSYDYADWIHAPQLRMERRNNSASWSPQIVFTSLGAVAIGTDDSSAINGRFQVYNGSTCLFKVMDNGNVGIGTANPTYTLSVNGGIRAKEVIVNTGWSDYVFEDGYKLRTIKETEEYIKTNKHLPDIPSGDQVQENGVSLGEMQSKLLQKIEELTLYVIELKKENEMLKDDIRALNK